MEPGSRQFSVQTTPPSPVMVWLVRIVSLAVFVAITVLAFLILLPLAVAILVLGIVLFVYFWIKAKFRRARDPGGPLDERRNVRVVNRDD